jgi:pimeloyl-ACP methyl ester carboxylesterase
VSPEGSLSADNSYFDSSSFGRVRYLDEGISERVLVLLHGWNSHSGTWKKVIPGLKDRFRVVAPSLPPHFGEFSDLPVQGYTALVAELLTHLDIGMAAFVGNSMGGWIALNVLCSFPHMVSALVLEDTAGIVFDQDADAMRSDPLVSCVIRSGVRTLIIWGAGDSIIPPRVGRALHDAISNSVYIEFADAGHAPHWQEPAKFVSALTEFIPQK